MNDNKYVVWLDEPEATDVSLTGGKGASLSVMIRNLKKNGVRVPDGFVITTHSFRRFIQEAGIKGSIEKLLSRLDRKTMSNLPQIGEKVRILIKDYKFPADVRGAILKAYDDIVAKYGNNISFAVRSSATAEDMADASFAGQHDSFLNVKGKDDILNAVKKCFASLFTDRAISYREDKGFAHTDIALSVVVQLMVRSDMASSGVIFTIDTESGFKDVVFITGSYGLGESIVQGMVNPDEYLVFKPALKKGFRSIISKKLGSKKTKTVFSKYQTRVMEVDENERRRYVLTDDEIIQLAEWACTVEDHYGKPMDIEWAKDGRSGKLFIVQARPETVHSVNNADFSERYVLDEKGKLLLKGKAVGSKIGQGRANVIKSVKFISNFRDGDVLVTDMTDPDWEPIMKKAAAIITNRGGRTCHTAIISRELGIPCVIGTEKGTEILEGVKEVTVSCAEGDAGKVYRGRLKYHKERIDVKSLPKTRTKIMMNIGIPGQAFSKGQIPNDGVGLAREEFIINSYIGIHPLALVHFEELKKRAENDEKIADVVRKIEEKTSSFKNKEDFFVEKLAQGIAKIAAGFYPNDVIVRLSDFKTNEYANLLGGYLYEVEESNPMLGWRGASRYYDPGFKPAFRMECMAIRKVREEMGLDNVKTMVPFCRTPEEGRKVIKTMEEFGLKRGQNGLEVYVMCEIPSNVIEAEAFADIFDGFSIGSNDLTQLALGLDRDSELVSHIYDERSETVKRLVKRVIEVAKKRGKKIGICGQAPSDFPEFAAFLVECGIDSISLNSDTVIKTKMLIAEKERELGIKPQ
jgi:pyruvate,water dikinase